MRASASKRPVTRAQALTNATLAAAGLLRRRSPTAPCSKGLEAEGHGVRLAPSRPLSPPLGRADFWRGGRPRKPLVEGLRQATGKARDALGIEIRCPARDSSRPASGINDLARPSFA